MTKVLNKIKGDCGEILAQKFLRKLKYKIIETNYKNKFGEIDIIAQKDGKIVFVEVKSRETSAFGRPIEAVDLNKQNKIKKVAEFYLILHNQYYQEVRFDVVELLDGEITLTENAFQ
ncbi:MAG: YraN family protein [Clostridiales bacterium]|nr:YraN family protein [Clostridiales bacterium]